MGLTCEMPFFTLRHSHKLNPRVLIGIVLDDFIRAIGRTIADDDPSDGTERLRQCRLDGSLNKRRLVPRRRYQRIREMTHLSMLVFQRSGSGGVNSHLNLPVSLSDKKTQARLKKFSCALNMVRVAQTKHYRGRRKVQLSFRACLSTKNLGHALPRYSFRIRNSLIAVLAFL